MITDIFLEEGAVHFSGTSVTGNDPAISFELVKCITKNIYT